VIHDWKAEEARERGEAIRERLHRKMAEAFPGSFQELLADQLLLLDRIDALEADNLALAQDRDQLRDTLERVERFLRPHIGQAAVDVLLPEIRAALNAS
jgi:hypothetical protein